VPKGIAFPLIEGWLRWVGGPVGVRLRRAWYRNRFKSCGARLTIDLGVIIEGAEHIIIGDDVWIDKQVILIAGPNGPPRDDYPAGVAHGEIHIGSASHVCPGVIIQGHGGVKINTHCTIGAGSTIYSQSNHVEETRQGTVPHGEYVPPKVDSPIVLGRNVWCGLGVKVLGGSIGDDVFIKANSVVTTNIPANRITGSSNNKETPRLRFPEKESMK
jgi:acetyltransferase-like isoleucine patch superfamily enzyme